MKEPILITGGAGFIGSHFARALVAQGESVVIADNFSFGDRANLEGVPVVIEECDCTDMPALRDVMERHNIRIVYNMAILCLPLSLKEPERVLRETAALTLALCTLLRENVYERLIQLSSSDVYGNASNIPVREEHPLDPCNAYAAAKASADMVILSYVRTYGSNATIIRPSNQYGPRQRLKNNAALVPTVIDLIRRGEPIEVSGDGLQTRDFLYVGDFVRALEAVRSRDNLAGEIINVGGGREVSVLEMIHVIGTAMGKEAVTHHRPSRPSDVRRRCTDITKAKALLGWEPTTPLLSGIRTTVQWYCR